MPRKDSLPEIDKENPFLALVPKNESPDGFAGKYIPVPLEYGNPQGYHIDRRPWINRSKTVNPATGIPC